jgi:Fe-S-cluster containining protein
VVNEPCGSDAAPDGDAEVRAWLDAAARPEVEAAIDAVLVMIDDAVHAMRPHCLASGHCCRFEAHGHRLYASGLEVARCIAICEAEGRGISAADVTAAVERGDCPWQIGRLCTAREGRPTGCRVYFCDPRVGELVPELAERAHAEIRSIHDRFEIPYAYGEWRALLHRVLSH